jgi:hypothetical protein
VVILHSPYGLRPLQTGSIDTEVRVRDSRNPQRTFNFQQSLANLGMDQQGRILLPALHAEPGQWLVALFLEGQCVFDESVSVYSQHEIDAAMHLVTGWLHRLPVGAATNSAKIRSLVPECSLACKLPVVGGQTTVAVEVSHPTLSQLLHACQVSVPVSAIPLRIVLGAYELPAGFDPVGLTFRYSIAGREIGQITCTPNAETPLTSQATITSDTRTSWRAEDEEALSAMLRAIPPLCS